jgi:hypothetical protein
MSSDLRTHAEARLAAAAAALGLADPRNPYRERLKQLRQSQPEAFERAVAHYEQDVLPLLAGEAPLDAWVEYGRFLGQITSNGRLTAIDASGHASPFRPPLRPDLLVLFLPEDTAAEALVAAVPARPAAAQQATLDLLVHRKLAL